MCTVNYGPEEGKTCVIANIQNQNRALVDGEDIKRQIIPIRRLTLSNLKIPISWGSRTGVIRKAIKKHNLKERWEATAAAKKIAIRKRRANLTDFERFKVTILRKRVNFLNQMSRIVRNKNLGVQVAKQKAKKQKKKGKK